MGWQCQHDLLSVCRSWMACSAPPTVFNLRLLFLLFLLWMKSWYDQRTKYVYNYFEIYVRIIWWWIVILNCEALWCVVSFYGICCFMVLYRLLLWLLSVWLLPFVVLCMSLFAYRWKCKLGKKTNKTPLLVDWPAAPSPRSWSGHCGRIPRSDTRGLYLRNDEGQESFFPVTFEGNLSSLRSKIAACCVNHDDVCVHISLPLLLASPASLYDYPALLIYRL